MASAGANLGITIVASTPGEGIDVRQGDEGGIGGSRVIASMLFVGLEIRQNNRLARAAAEQAIGIASAAAWDTQAHDRDFLVATQKDPAAMDSTDWRQRAAKYTVFARLGEMVLSQVDQGLLEAEAMEDFGFGGWRHLFEDPAHACLWPLIRPGVSARFREWVEEGRDPGAIDCGEFAIPGTIL